MDLTKVGSISPEIQEIQSRIKPIVALLGGTQAMREAGEAYLPKFKSEICDTSNGDQLYKSRLNKSTLVPYFEDTIRSMVGRVFHKPFIYDLPESISQYLSDFDLRGNSASEVFESCFFEALAFSKSYVVIDYTLRDGVRTIAEEIQSGARPFAYKINLQDVLDVRESSGRITLFKYIRSVVDEDATTDLEVVYVDEVVLMTAGLTRIYRKDKEGQFYEHGQFEIKIGGEYADHVMVTELKLSRKPPLQNLADLNIKHWQSQSSQDNIVDTARVPILALIGITGVKLDAIFVSGGLNLPANGDAKYIEHSGAAIESGQKSLDKLEEQMSVAGAKLITKTRMALTDTQAKGEQEKEVSELMLYGMLLQGFIKQSLMMFGEWVNVKEDTILIDITDNLRNTIVTEGSTTDVIQANNSDIISKQTAFDTLQAKNIIVTNRTFEQEQEAIEIERAIGISRLTDLPE